MNTTQNTEHTPGPLEPQRQLSLDEVKAIDAWFDANSKPNADYADVCKCAFHFGSTTLYFYKFDPRRKWDW